MKNTKSQQKGIRLGTHGEKYGNWMSNPVFYMVGGLLALAAVLALMLVPAGHVYAFDVQPLALERT